MKALCFGVLLLLSDPLRAQDAVRVPGTVRHDYFTAYYMPVDTFDFLTTKVWNTTGNERVWRFFSGYIEDKILTRGGRVVYPDTVFFERYISGQGRLQRYMLSRFTDDIYQVWTRHPFHYFYEGRRFDMEAGNYLGIHQGWPDDYMNGRARKTDVKKALAAITNIAGMRKAER